MHLIPASGFADRLPMLSTAERDTIRAGTESAVRRLIAVGAWSRHTVRAYAGALRYWDAWHHACYDTPLPLLADPREAVPPETVKIFIAHHAPQAHDGHIGLGMPEPVQRRLLALEAVGRRHAAVHADADPLVPSLATLRHRVTSLNSLHTSLELPSPSSRDPYIAHLLRAAAGVASSEAPAVLRRPKAPVTRALLLAILDHCAQDGLRGLRDAALIHVAFHTGGRRRSELASLRWHHLEPLPASATPAPDAVRGYRWAIAVAKGKRRTRADRAAAETVILNAAADALDAWRRQMQAAAAFSPTGAVWLRLQAAPEGKWVFKGPMDEEDTAAVLKGRVAECGLDPARYAGHSLRSGAVTTALEEGEALADVSAMVQHTSMGTTRTYYDHRPVPIDALVRLVK